jgi:hypothetical protein
MVATILWRLVIATKWASVTLANLGGLLVHLKWVSCPIAALLIWVRGDNGLAILALLWPLAVLLLLLVTNRFGVVASGFARRNMLKGELEEVENRFKEALLRKGFRP